ncbi:hypothetical protein J6590_054484 [Homalodisca vitripennis]|nr:hypothetical protein J6590_054484 [Homalodisca vitripennis]
MCSLEHYLHDNSGLRCEAPQNVHHIAEEITQIRPALVVSYKITAVSNTRADNCGVIFDREVQRLGRVGNKQWWLNLAPAAGTELISAAVRRRRLAAINTCNCDVYLQECGRLRSRC